MAEQELPRWVLDVVMALQKWNDEHPVLFQFAGASDDPVKVEDCGCSALAMVPAQVRNQAAAIARYVAQPQPVDNVVDKPH